MHPYVGLAIFQIGAKGSIIMAVLMLYTVYVNHKWTCLVCKEHSIERKWVKQYSDGQRWMNVSQFVASATNAYKTNYIYKELSLIFKFHFKQNDSEGAKVMKMLSNQIFYLWIDRAISTIIGNL